MTDASEQGHINEGPAPFRREDRYIVIKRKDVEALDERDTHRGLLTDLYAVLDDLKPLLPERSYVVVESDWPEHDVVWAAIEERMALVDGRRPGLAEQGLTRSYEEAFYALASALGFSGARACSPQHAMHELMLPRIRHLQDCAAAHREFSDKTDWVQSKDTPAGYLGRHRADIITAMLKDAQAERDRLRAQLDEAKGLLWSAIDPVDRPLQRMRIREFLGPRTTGVEATPRTTGVPTGALREVGSEHPPEVVVLSGTPVRLVPHDTVPLREAIALAVEAQTGASPTTAQTKARAAMLLLSIDESTVVLGGE